MIKRLVIAVLLLALVGGGIVWFNFFRASMIDQFFATMTPAPVPVSVSTVERGRWTPGIETIGTARAAQGVDLAIEASGVVREIGFSANDRIEAGDILIQIDDRSERADLAAAEAALELAESELERARALQARGVSAVNVVDTAQAQATSARASVERLRAILETKRLIAPFDGIIGIPQVETGQFVAPGDIFATLQDRANMRVDFTVTEQQLPLLGPGQPVTVRAETGGVAASGTIIGIEPRIDANSRLVAVRAALPDAGEALVPGQFLQVRVELPVEDGVIALPQTVVNSSLYGDSVYVVRDGATADDPAQVEQVFVTLGRRSGALVEIVRGLEDGDRVVNAGQNRLSPGAPVVIDNTVSPAGMAPAGAGAEGDASGDAPGSDGADAATGASGDDTAGGGATGAADPALPATAGGAVADPSTGGGASTEGSAAAGGAPAPAN